MDMPPLAERIHSRRQSVAKKLVKRYAEDFSDDGKPIEARGISARLVERNLVAGNTYLSRKRLLR